MNKINIFIAVLILAVALLGAYYFISNPAHTEKKADIAPSIISVKAMPVTLGSYPVKIEVLGQVTPAREASIKAQVSGQVIEVDSEFILGGIFGKGAQILQIDPADYKLDVNVKRAAVSQANAALKLELGQQEIAKDELKIIEQSTGRKLKSNDLALRKPQLEQARANLNAAKAQAEQAKLNLERTKIIAPFDGIITARNTNIGNIVNTQNVIATLVATDEYWIEVEIPVHDTIWLKNGAKALITLNNGLGTREGELLKISGSLNENNRLATLLVSVKDPLKGASLLIIGDYVHATLFGQELKNTARIPTKYIRNNNVIWIARDGKLVVQPVIIAYSDREFAYVTKGLKRGDNIVTSNIVTPINGMDIKVQDNE